MIAVLHLDVHTSVCHVPRQAAELTRLSLAQPEGDYIPLRDYAQSGGLESFARSFAVLEKKMRGGLRAAFTRPDAAAFDVDVSLGKRLSHLGERAGSILKNDLEILHGWLRHLRVGLRRDNNHLVSRASEK